MQAMPHSGGKKHTLTEKNMFISELWVNYLLRYNLYNGISLPLLSTMSDQCHSLQCQDQNTRQQIVLSLRLLGIKAKSRSRPVYDSLK